MLCKKCKKELQEDWLYCPWCGSGAKKDPKKKMYQRPDGLYEKILAVKGKRITFRGKSEREVMQKIAAYTGKMENAKAKPFKVYAEELERSWDGLAYNSLRGYKPALRRCVETFGETPISEITPLMVQKFLDKLGKTYAKKTVNTHKSVLSQAFGIAIMAMDISASPINEFIRASGKESVEREEASESDRQKIAEHWDESVISKLAYFIMMTGTRVGEALGMRYEDIDYEKNIIEIWRTVYFVGSYPKLKEPKTKAGKRTIVLLPELAEKFHGHGEMFLTDQGTMLRSHEVTRWWKKFREKYGIECTFHQLRHSFATSCCEAGIDPKVIQQMMGHSSYIVTDHYTHIREEMLQRAREQLDEVI